MFLFLIAVWVVALAMGRASVKKLEQQNQSIEQRFDTIQLKLTDLKVTVLESEMERSRIKDKVQSSDVDYQLKMKALQERISKLKKEMK